MGMRKLLCFGSLNIDYTYTVPHFVTPGETLPAEGMQVFSGGKGLNQSVALARAGLDVSLAGAIGEDGRFLLEQLHAAGVDTRHVSVLSQVRTGHAIIQNDPSGDNCILVYGGANHCTTREQADRALADFSASDMLVVQNEINDLDYILRAADAAGLTIAMTPAPMTDAVRRLPLDCVDYLFLNEIEGGQLLNGEIDPEAEPIRAARELRRRYGPGAVILTLGEQGAVYADIRGESGVCPALRVDVVDTTGAGDAFFAGVAIGLTYGKTVGEACVIGTRLAASVITSRENVCPRFRPEEFGIDVKTE